MRVNKVHALEDMLAEHEAIKVEVALLHDERSKYPHVQREITLGIAHLFYDL